MILGGASANVADRLVRRGVVDFLDTHAGNLRPPAFNLADSAIIVTAVLLFLGDMGARGRPRPG